MKIDCKKYAQEILDEVKLVPNKKTLAILSVGDDPASQSYIKGKIKDCEYCGIPYRHMQLPPMVLSSAIEEQNADPEIGGIIVQLPLPSGMNANRYLRKVQAAKDVDGFRSNSPFKPCTPEGIMYLLYQEIGVLTGKTALVIGRGKLVGKPMARLLLDADCTVINAHSQTQNLPELLQVADIVVSGVGKPGVVDLQYCKQGAVVIDAGISRTQEGKLVGDCFGSHEGLKVTPVPGGVGLMTRAMLMRHMATANRSTREEIKHWTLVSADEKQEDKR